MLEKKKSATRAKAQRQDRHDVVRLLNKVKVALANSSEKAGFRK